MKEFTNPSMNEELTEKINTYISKLEEILYSAENKDMSNISMLLVSLSNILSKNKDIEGYAAYKRKEMEFYQEYKKLRNDNNDNVNIIESEIVRSTNRINDVIGDAVESLEKMKQQRKYITNPSDRLRDMVIKIGGGRNVIENIKERYKSDSTLFIAVVVVIIVFIMFLRFY
ncbi:hypothetical protein SLOPH_1870 [Spraguea lophii 42_110]|uniref:Uncharacterized protein n=1 Tax=Spraguea lophii (strain 42_110) TaxID=1358809 RepID=S7XV91_SPRLO|nr:hypothetical protein SLOPH_1870 [Spraguea lophii 42_110]